MNLKELSKGFNYLNESKFQVGDIVVPNIGAHKGEFLESALKIEKVNSFYAFEPQKNIFKGLN